MTDTDNKDPQITPEMVQKWLETYSSYEDMYNGTIDATDIARGYLHQAAELKQLRAERAGFIKYIDEELAVLAIGGCDPTSNTQRQVLHKLKSKLTDSAQRGENKNAD